MPDTKVGHRTLSWRVRTAIALLIILPLTAVMMYMYSLWDPRPSLGNVPLALVNEDQGTDVDGEHKNFGEQTAQGLLNTGYLNFTEVSAEEADKGLKSTHYLMTVRIPPDFSQKTASVISSKPEHPTIEINTNDLNGTNGAFVTGSLIPKLSAQINKEISTTYAKEVLSGMSQLSKGLGTAADGASQLADGSGQLRTGVGQLADGSGQLRAGIGTLVDGSAQLVDGGKRLQGGTDQLAGGMQQIDGGVRKLNTMMIPLLQQLGTVAPTLENVSGVLKTLQRPADAAKLDSVVQMLDSTNPNNLVSQLNQLQAGTGQVLYNLGNPNSEYRGGLNQLVDGLEQAQAGVGKLSDGAAQLDDGIHQLEDGSIQLNDGSVLLSTSLKEGARKAPNIAQLNSSAEQIGSPIRFVSYNLHPVEEETNPQDPTELTPASGISAVVMIIFGFVLMLVVSLLLPDLHKAFHWRKALSQAGILVLSGAAIFALLWKLNESIGWQPVATGSMLGGVALMILSNAGILVAVRSFFSRVTASLIALGVFIVGAFSFGGIYPLPVAPAIFRLLHPLYWLSYQRDAYIAATEGLGGGQLFSGVAGMLVVSILCGALVALRGLYLRRAARKAELES